MVKTNRKYQPNDNEAAENNKNLVKNDTVNGQQGFVNNAYYPSDPNLFTVSRKLTDEDNLNTVLQRQLGGQISTTKRSFFKRPIFIIPIILISIAASVLVIGGVVYAIFKTRDNMDKIKHGETMTNINTNTVTAVIHVTPAPTSTRSKGFI